VLGAPVADFEKLGSHEADDASKLVVKLSARLLQRELPRAASDVVVTHLERALPVSPSAPARARELRDRSRAVVHMLLCTPEFALA
ncbi:MAG TPA: hypothetical protein VM509_12720, partial [Planctomycetota bacterium]|nr:hypothetical protein [Planctomycetota bacterium]